MIKSSNILNIHRPIPIEKKKLRWHLKDANIVACLISSVPQSDGSNSKGHKPGPRNSSSHQSKEGPGTFYALKVNRRVF